MAMIELKRPAAAYPARFNRFLWLLMSVKGLKPKDRHLWKVMDGPAFQDAETALEVELFNEGETLGEVAVLEDTLCIRRTSRKPKARPAKVAND